MIICAGRGLVEADGTVLAATCLIMLSSNLSVVMQQERFQAMSDTIIKRIDDMGTKIEELEGSINKLMEEATKPLEGAEGDHEAPK